MDEKEIMIGNDLNEVVENEVTEYVDEFGNPIDPSLIDENGNYIGEEVTEYVDEFGNPIDPSLIDENGNYIGNNMNSTQIDENEIAKSLSDAVEPEIEIPEVAHENTTIVEPAIESASAHQMDDKDFLTGMVTFDYNNVPITDIVNSIILDAINKGASDIHFDPFEEGIKIRVRVDGELNDYSIVPLYVKRNMITRIKIIAGMNITESRIPQDGAIRTELQNKTIDLRVSCLPTNMGEKIVVRIMDYSMSSAGIEALDFNEKNLDKVKKMMALPNGIILVTGATGSGKSTTVYAMLQKLNVEGTNLVTVEDPIEMNIGGINQVQAASEIGLTFATVLRSILRQDPDVIMIGEIRDDETARIAVRASITGHLVLSTIHTNNSLNTIERLTDMSVERYLLGSSLSGIISQKLSRRLCEKCKRLRPTTDYEKEIFKNVLNKDIDEIYEPVGCNECSKGYRGRIAIHEVLLLNQSIQDAITKGTPKEELRKLVYGVNGTETMLEDGLNKVLEGKTSFAEILKLIDLEDDLGSGTQLGLIDQINDSKLNDDKSSDKKDEPKKKNNKKSSKKKKKDEEIVVEEPVIDEVPITEEPIIIEEEKQVDNHPQVEEEPIVIEEENKPISKEEFDLFKKDDNNEDINNILDDKFLDDLVKDIELDNQVETINLDNVNQDNIIRIEDDNNEILDSISIDNNIDDNNNLNIKEEDIDFDLDDQTIDELLNTLDNE